MTGGGFDGRMSRGQRMNQLGKLLGSNLDVRHENSPGSKSDKSDLKCCLSLL